MGPFHHRCREKIAEPLIQACMRALLPSHFSKPSIIISNFPFPQPSISRFSPTASD